MMKSRIRWTSSAGSSIPKVNSPTALSLASGDSEDEYDPTGPLDDDADSGAEDVGADDPINLQVEMPKVRTKHVFSSFLINSGC